MTQQKVTPVKRGENNKSPALQLVQLVIFGNIEADDLTGCSDVVGPCA